VLTAVGVAIQIGTTSWGVVYLGRLVLGVGNGFLVTFSNIYCAEAAPAHLRAVLVALFSEWVNIGSIVGAAVTNATAKVLNKSAYQIPLGIQFVVPVALAVGLFFVPESPRYLVNKGKLEEGRKALEVLRGDSLQEEQLQLEWFEMVKGIKEEKRIASSVGPLDMFRGTLLPARKDFWYQWLMMTRLPRPTGSNLRRTLLCFGVIASEFIPFYPRAATVHY
jgi:MFS family permease